MALNRREFLKFVSATAGTSALAACETPGEMSRKHWHTERHGCLRFFSGFSGNTHGLNTLRLYQ